MRAVGDEHRQEMIEMGLLNHDPMIDPLHYVADFLRSFPAPHYVSVDIDVCDPAFAPGVSDPVPGGLTSRELIQIVRLCARSSSLIALDVMECVPAMDDAMLTVHLAGWLVVEALSNLPSLD